MFIVQPGFVQGLVQKVGFTEQGAGYTASVEMFGIAATTVALTFLANRLDWRKLLYVSLLVMFVTNAASAYVHDLNTFAVVRFFAGLASGTLITLSFTAIGLTRKVDRNFGLLIMWVLLYGAFGLLRDAGCLSGARHERCAVVLRLVPAAGNSSRAAHAALRHHGRRKSGTTRWS